MGAGRAEAAGLLDNTAEPPAAFAPWAGEEPEDGGDDEEGPVAGPSGVKRTLTPEPEPAGNEQDDAEADQRAAGDDNDAGQAADGQPEREGDGTPNPDGAEAQGKGAEALDDARDRPSPRPRASRRRSATPSRKATP